MFVHFDLDHHTHDHGGGHSHHHGHGHNHGNHSKSHKHHGHKLLDNTQNEHSVESHPNHMSHDNCTGHNGNYGVESDANVLRNEEADDVFNVNENPRLATKQDMASEESNTNTSSSSNSQDALNPNGVAFNESDDSNTSFHVNTMSDQIAAPCFTCYFCRNSIPAAYRCVSHPDSCTKCAGSHNLPVITVK